MKRKNVRGSVLIEFVIALPIMIFFIFAIADFTAYFRNRYMVNNLASSVVHVPISIIQQKINDSYQNGEDMQLLLQNINMDDVFDKASAVVFNVFSMVIKSENVKMTCYWSIGKNEKDNAGRNNTKFYQKRVDSQNGGVDSMLSSINADSICGDTISNSVVIAVEVLLQYSDTDNPYIKKWEWIDKWKNFKSSCKRILDNDSNIFDKFLNSLP